MLVLHGFTGNPTTMRPIAEHWPAPVTAWSCRDCPATARRSRTSMTTRGPTGPAAEAAYDALAARCERVAVVGLSMGAGSPPTSPRRAPVAGVRPHQPAREAPPDDARGRRASSSRAGSMTSRPLARTSRREGVEGVLRRDTARAAREPLRGHRGRHENLAAHQRAGACWSRAARTTSSPGTTATDLVDARSRARRAGLARELLPRGDARQRPRDSSSR